MRHPTSGDRREQKPAAKRSCLGRLLRFAFSALVLAGVVGAVAFVGLRHWLNEGLEQNLTPDGPLTVEIAAGTHTVAALQQVYEAAGVPFGRREQTLLWLVEFDNCVQRGTHTIPADATYRTVLQELCQRTSRSTQRLTIREGLNQWEVVDAIAAAGLSNRADLLAAVEGAEPPLPGSTTGAEGYLFPNTYEFYREADAATVVERLVTESETQIDRAFAEAGLELPSDSNVPLLHGLTAHELMILASMVEAEAAVPDERALIARVFVNRLADGMRLQSDPTCMYGEELYGRPATRSACRDSESRYSTYVINGLPPGPIGSPGLASIQAVLSPADDPDVLYFVAVGDGSRRHRFADTYDEHRANVALYREAVGD
jgi:UPF0755 protein